MFNNTDSWFAYINGNLTRLFNYTFGFYWSFLMNIDMEFTWWFFQVTYNPVIVHLYYWLIECINQWIEWINAEEDYSWLIWPDEVSTLPYPSCLWGNRNLHNVFHNVSLDGFVLPVLSGYLNRPISVPTGCFNVLRISSFSNNSKFPRVRQICIPITLIGLYINIVFINELYSVFCGISINWVFIFYPVSLLVMFVLLVNWCVSFSLN